MIEALEDFGINTLTEIINEIYYSGNIQEDLSKSIFLHRTINLMSHVVKIVLRIIIQRARKSTARKSGNISSHTEKLFSSDTRQSMKRRIATEKLFKIYIARCGYTWLDLASG